MQTKIHEPTQIVDHAHPTPNRQTRLRSCLATRAPHSGQPRSAPVGLVGMVEVIKAHGIVPSVMSMLSTRSFG